MSILAAKASTARRSSSVSMTLIHNDGIDGFGLSRCGALGRQCQSGDGGSGRGALGGRGGALRIQRQLGDVFLFVHKVPPYLYLTAAGQ